MLDGTTCNPSVHRLRDHLLGQKYLPHLRRLIYPNLAGLRAEDRLNEDFGAFWKGCLEDRGVEKSTLTPAGVNYSPAWSWKRSLLQFCRADGQTVPCCFPELKKKILETETTCTGKAVEREKCVMGSIIYKGAVHRQSARNLLERKTPVLSCRRSIPPIWQKNHFKVLINLPTCCL